jgi:ATP adenylyltransferase/5',5'''-P-1,P-4-tetraphosphate phosphorylase II
MPEGFWYNGGIKIGNMVGHKNIRLVPVPWFQENIAVPDEDEQEPDIGPDDAAIIHQVAPTHPAKWKNDQRPKENRDHQQDEGDQGIQHINYPERTQQGRHH